MTATYLFSEQNFDNSKQQTFLKNQQAVEQFC